MPTEAIVSGYGDRSLLPGDFASRLRLGRVDYSLCVLRWYEQRGFAAGVEAAKRVLMRDLA